MNTIRIVIDQRGITTTTVTLERNGVPIAHGIIPNDFIKPGTISTITLEETYKPGA